MQERESVWEGSGFKRTMSTRLYTFSHSVLDGSVWNTRAVWFSLRGETRSHPHLPLIGYFLIHLFTPQPPHGAHFLILYYPPTPRTRKRDVSETDAPSTSNQFSAARSQTCTSLRTRREPHAHAAGDSLLAP